MADHDLDELLRRANSEPNPRLRAQYGQALIKARGGGFTSSPIGAVPSQRLTDLLSGFINNSRLARFAVDQFQKILRGLQAGFTQGDLDQGTIKQLFQEAKRIQQYGKLLESGLEDLLNQGKAAPSGEMRKVEKSWKRVTLVVTLRVDPKTWADDGAKLEDFIGECVDNKDGGTSIEVVDVTNRSAI